MRKWLLLPLLAGLVAGCGSSSNSSGAPTSVTVSTVVVTNPAPPTALTVFRVQDGKLHAEVVSVPHTTAVASAALRALGLAAPVTIAGGTARVALDTVSADETAEIVYTLTRFPSIERVDVAGRMGLTRTDVASYVPPILIESPGAGAEVPRAIQVSGTASVFEATLVVELVADGKVVAKNTVTASEGAPARGTFETTLQATASGPATVSAFSPSAENGTPQHQVDVPVVVTP
jgi:hypothetical protein